MRNKIDDLRNHLFMLLEDLTAEHETEEAKQAAIEKAHAGASLGKVIVDSAKTEILFLDKQYKSQNEIKTPKLLQNYESNTKPNS